MADDALIALTAQIVTAYVERNPLGPAELPQMIQSVHQTLRSADKPASEPVARLELTAAQIRKSITPEGLISFEDGKSYKQLKRHLTTRGMTLADYLAKWGLPADYPSVAPAYAARRSEIAKAAGLGKVVNGRARTGRKA